MSAIKYSLFLLFLFWTSIAQATITIDGSTANNTGGPNPFLTMVLSTSNADDIIVVPVAVNSGDITSIVGSGLTFTKRAEEPNGGGGSQPIEYWTSLAASPLSSVTITINNSTSDFITAAAFGISGTNTSSPFDANGVLPITKTSGTISTLSTSNANDILLCFYRQSAISSPTAGSGFTAISGGSNPYALWQYKIVSTTQSNLSCGEGGGTTNTDSNGGIADAIVAYVAPPVLGTLTTLQPILFGGTP